MIDTLDDRLAMIRVILPETSLFFIQVYLPTTSFPLDQFIEYVDKVFDLYNMHCSDGNVIITGDFNSRIANDTRHGKLFLTGIDIRFDNVIAFIDFSNCLPLIDIAIIGKVN